MTYVFSTHGLRLKIGRKEEEKERLHAFSNAAYIRTLPQEEGAPARSHFIRTHNLMKDTPIIAIDAGKSGGIAWKFGSVLGCEKMPSTDSDVVQLLRDLKIACSECERGVPSVILEKVGGYVGLPQTGSSMFNFGKGYGVLIGAVCALEMPLSLVRPQQWQKDLGLGPKGDRSTQEWKRHLRDAAQKLYPSQKATLSTGDALLILKWGGKCS